VVAVSGEDSNGTADIPDTPRRRRRTVPPIIDLTARESQEPVTPVDVQVVRVNPLPPPTDPMTMTGSLPILSDAVAAIEEEKHKMERSTAEARRDDVADQITTIIEWWQRLTDDDINGCMAKAEEYGSGDLEMMGQAMIQLQGDVWEGGDAADKARIGQELAVLFYIHGKVARALAAARNGRPCSDDTIKDIRIYAVMLQRIRETGKWVG
jgi:hypothetical protein